MNRLTKKLTLVFALMLLMLAGAGWAQTGTFDIGSGSCTEGDCNSTSWSTNMGIPLLTVNSGADIKITGNNTNCQIDIAVGAVATITLDNVTAGTLNRKPGSQPTFILEGDNTFSYSGGNTTNGDKTTISGSGSLEVTGGWYWGGSLTINSGTVTITSPSTNITVPITVNGGDVTLNPGSGCTVTGNLTISGGTVTVDETKVTGQINHTGGLLNGNLPTTTPPPNTFGPVPNTGLPDITLYTYLMFFFGGVSVLLWGHVLYCKFFGKKG